MDFAQYAQECTAELACIDTAEVDRLVYAIEEAYRDNRTVFIIGNGGSAANASHLCEDLGKGVLSDLENQKRLRVLSLTDNVPYILAWANDTDFEQIFVEQLKNLASPGDLLIAISGSGNSPNIIRAVEYANGHEIKTFGVTGYDGGALVKLAHDCLHVKCNDMGMVEAVHGVVFHYVVDALRESFRK